MKKNGFTLTEVLAVIVILVILILIGTPVYFTITNNAKKNELKSKLDYLGAQAVKYAEEQGLEGSHTITGATLVSNGYVVADDYINESNIPIITNPTDLNDNLACRLINLDVDGFDYKANVSDESNCDLVESEIKLSSISVKAYRLFNNTIKDEISKSDDNSFAWVNSDVLLVVYPEDGVKNIKITRGGITKESNGIDIQKNFNVGSMINPNNLANNAIIVSAISILREQIYISVQKDNEILNANAEVKIDKENPIVTSSVYNGWTTGEKSISAYISDGIGSGAKRACLTKEKVFNENNCSNAKDGVAVISANEEGLYYLWAEDNVGNKSVEPSTVKVTNTDNNDPQCVIIKQGVANHWTKEPVTVRWGCFDDESGCDSANSGSVKIFDSGKPVTTWKTPEYDIKDNAGRSKHCNSVVVNVYYDSEAPECIEPNQNSTWTKNAVTIRWGCNDKQGSGCNSSYSGGSQTFNSGTVPTFNTPKYTIIDNAGNTTSCLGKTVEVKHDSEAPDCYHVDKSDKVWRNTDITIRWSGVDKGVGPDSAYNGGSKTFTSGVVKTYSASAYTVKDKLGNTRSCPAWTANVYLDKLKPVCKIFNENTKWTNSPVTVRWGCEDGDSGCNNISGSSGSKVFSSGEYYGYQIPTYTIKDNAGNSNTCNLSANVYLDTVKPDCYVSDNDTWTSSPVTIYYGGSDKTSGGATSTKSITYSGANREINTTTLSTYTIKDYAGNTKECTPTVSVKYDSKAPSCWHDNNTTWTNSPVVLAHGCTDGGSGCTTSMKTKTYDNNKAYKTDTLKSYTIKDYAGNSNTCTPTLKVYYDPVPPHAYPKANPLILPSSGIRLNDFVDGSDDDSGISYVSCDPSLSSNKSYDVNCKVYDVANNYTFVSFRVRHSYIPSPTKVTSSQYCGTKTEEKCEKVSSCCADGSSGHNCSCGEGNEDTSDCCSDSNPGWDYNGCSPCEKTECKNVQVDETCDIYVCDSNSYHEDRSTKSRDLKVCIYD